MVETQAKSLTQEIAAPSTTGVRQSMYPSAASGLTPERLAAIIVQVDQNDITEYLTLAEEMEERDLHYHSVLSTRKLAVSGLDVHVEAYDDTPKHKKIAEFVTEVMETKRLTQLMTEQMDALGKGFSVNEIIWDRSGSLWEPAKYIWRDPRYFQFDLETGNDLRLRDEQDLVNGIELPPYKFIQHRPNIKTGLPIRGGLARLASLAYMCKGYGLKDWMAFAEVFGMPLRLGKYAPGATADQKAALLRAVANIGIDAAAIIPDDMLIEFIEASKSTGGDKLFQGLADWFDMQVSKGVLGQTASTQGTPGKLGGDDAQENVREDIRIADAGQLAITLRRDLVKPLVDLNFGPLSEREYPTITLMTEAREDLESLSRALPPFINLGLQVEESVIRDKFGLPEPAEGAKLLAARPQPSFTSPFGAQGPQGTNLPEADDEENPIEEELQRVTIHLMKEVAMGHPISDDQRSLLMSSLHMKAINQVRQDEIDKMTDEALQGWRKVIDPMVAPFIEAVENAESPEDMKKKLEDLKGRLPPDEFMHALALLTFQSRAFGDIKDKL